MQNNEPHLPTVSEKPKKSSFVIRGPISINQTRPLFTGSGIAILFGILLPLILFAVLVSEISQNNILNKEQQILFFIHTYASPVLVQLAKNISTFVTIFSLATLAYFLWRRVWRIAIFWLVSVGGVAILASILKHVFHRNRPHLWEQVVAHASYSFPSGHSTQSMAIGVALILIFRNSRQFVWIVISVACFVMMVGLSRLYLGVHYPTDILASWLLATAWVISISLIFNHFHRKHRE